VCWSDGAAAALEAIIDYVQVFDANAGADLAALLVAATDTLECFPNRGRETADGTRELLTVRPYAIRYRFVGQRVELLRIRDLRSRAGD